MDNGLTTFDIWILGIAILLISFGTLMGMLTVFRRLRKFAGMALMITAVMLGVTVWLLAADTVISSWTGPLIIGVWWALSRRCQWCR
jgi:Kef-type K+ transport system membrane component KefB